MTKQKKSQKKSPEPPTNQEIVAAYRYTLKHNFYFFFKESWHILEPATDLVSNWHHKYICDLLQVETERIGAKKKKTKDIIINLPFRSSKSTIVSQMWIAWAWIRFPHMRFITSSYAMRLATRDAKKTRDLIDSQWYQELFGDSFTWTSDQNVKTEYQNDKTGKRFVTSTDSNVMGEGGDVLIFDDPNNTKKIKAANFDSVNEAYDDVFYSRLNDDSIGLRIIIQQRTGEDDLTGHIMEEYPEDIKHIVIPAEVSDDIHPPELLKYYDNGFFWEWKFDRKRLDKWEKVLGVTAYTGQLQQNPESKEGNKIKRAWFQIIKEAELPFNLGNAEDYENGDDEDNAPFLGADIWIDGAYTESTKNDPTGLMSSIFFDGNLYIINAVDKWLELYELLKYIKGYAKENYHGAKNTVFIEPKASGKSIKSMLNKKKFNCVEIQNKVVSLGKMSRVEDAEPTLESGKVFLLKGPWNKKFIKQCATFPNAKHDEHVDNLCYNIDRHFLNKREGHESR